MIHKTSTKLNFECLFTKIKILSALNYCQGMKYQVKKNVKLTEFSTGGGCGCKVSPEVLKKLLNSERIKLLPKDLIVGLTNSDDAAVYKIDKERAIVATTDFFMPIVNNPSEFGEISATNALSDLYAMGAKPLFALAIVAMPIKKISLNIIKKIISGGEKICKNAGIPIAGGHTIESSEPIYGLVAIGIIKIREIKTNSKAEHEDDLILTKPIGTGILSTAIKKDIASKEQYNELIKSCTKLNDVGIYLSEKNLVSSMTDVTGFGLLGHLKEICLASKKKAIIQYKKIPIFEGTEKLVDNKIFTGASSRNWNSYKKYISKNSKVEQIKKIILSDPQTSGGLLLSCKKQNSKKILKILKSRRFKSSTIIGSIKNGKTKICIK